MNAKNSMERTGFPTAEDVIARLRTVTNTATDAALAAVLQVSNKTVSSWKKRNCIPFEHSLTVSLKTGVSLDWIFTGTREFAPAKRPKNGRFNDPATPLKRRSILGQ